MKRRGWKRLGLIMGILAILLIAAAIILPMILDLNRTPVEDPV